MLKRLVLAPILVFAASSVHADGVATTSGIPASTLSQTGSIDGGPAPLIHVLSGATKSAQQLADEAAAKDKQNQMLSALLQAIGGWANPNKNAEDESGSGGTATDSGTGGDYGNNSGTPNSGWVNSLTPVAPGELTGNYPIVPTFNKYFENCASQTGLGSCKFKNMGIMGDEAHQQRRSCHNTGEAIDVGPLTCQNGGEINPGDPRFFEMARCMAHNTNNELQVIFYETDGANMMYAKGHTDHMHVQLMHCAMVTAADARQMKRAGK